VGSLSEVSWAQLDARVEGVRDIVALLEVDETLIDSRQARFTETRSDQALQEALKDTFRYDSRLKGALLRARVESGLVTLEGTVSCAAAHRAAVDDALNVVGVRQVVDQIAVRPAVKFGDRAIEARIRQALRENPRLRSEISVSVYDGTAVLHGMVASASERAEIERTVGSVAGVAVIEDATQVQGPSSPLMSDEELASRARSLLSWNAEVGPNNVRIIVSDGVMTVTGTVDSWRQFNAIMEDIYGLGPTKVVQRIDVRSAGKTEPARFLETWDMQAVDSAASPVTPASGRAEPRSAPKVERPPAR
jgi:osmotically-inducible protein OsmY